MKAFSSSGIDWYALLSFLVPLAGYLLTLAPSVTFFDSGEFMTAIYSLGSAHSPGYPLFINYANPFTLIPFGSIAFRINFATAVSAGLACCGVYLLTSHLLTATRSDHASAVPARTVSIVALAVALTFAFTPRLWLQSNHDKPYPLLAFIVAMILYLLLIWREGYRLGEERPGLVYLGAFLAGLATGAHQTIVLLVPAFAWLVVSADWRVLKRFREIAIASSFALLGFAVQLHLPVRAVARPLQNWGDPQTAGQFLWHFLRKGYPTEKPVRDLPLLIEQVNAFNLPHELTVAGLALVLVGIVVNLKRNRDVIIGWLVALVTFLVVIVGYFNTSSEFIFLTEEFFTPLYLYASVLMGLGLYWGIASLHIFFVAGRFNPRFIGLLLSMLIFSLPVSVFSLNFWENNQRENYVAHDYATNTLRSLPEKAAYFTWGDSGAFPLWYLQGVERMRDDVLLLHIPHLVFTWYLDAFPGIFDKSELRLLPPEAQTSVAALQVAINEQLPLRPVLVDFSTKFSVEFVQGYDIQRGIAYQVGFGKADRPRQPDLKVWELYSLRGVYGDLFFNDLDTTKAILIYAYSRLEGGETLYRLGLPHAGLVELKKAVAISPLLEEQALRISRGGTQ